jgi:hypothetical protein
MGWVRGCWKNTLGGGFESAPLVRPHSAPAVWAQLAALWSEVADRKAAKEGQQLLPRLETENSPADESDAETGN